MSGYRQAAVGIAAVAVLLLIWLTNPWFKLEGDLRGIVTIAFEWYRDFLNALINANAQTWFAPLIAFGELAVGLGLLFGALTGVAAFFGALMNMSFLLAGSASSNPVLFTLAIGIILAWRVAGYYGIDRYLLPIMGTPWQRGPALGGPPEREPATS